MKIKIVNEKLDRASMLIEPVLLVNIKSQRLYSDTTSEQRDRLLRIIAMQYGYTLTNILDLTCANIYLANAVNFN